MAGREVAFPTAGAIAEFVRRLYLRSGGGDAPPIGAGRPTHPICPAIRRPASLFSLNEPALPRPSC